MNVGTYLFTQVPTYLFKIIEIHVLFYSANDFNDIVDMDMDSPFSPQSSEGSDIFEPPSLFTPPKKKRKANGNVSSSTKLHSKMGKKGKG